MNGNNQYCPTCGAVIGGESAFGDVLDDILEVNRKVQLSIKEIAVKMYDLKSSSDPKALHSSADELLQDLIRILAEEDVSRKELVKGILEDYRSLLKWYA